jgi:predicted TIM-barrel fold metal-dependent hydrolase
MAVTPAPAVPVIDVHGHMTAPDKLFSYKGQLVSHRGSHPWDPLRLSDDELLAAYANRNPAFGGLSHLEHLDQAGIGLQFISPRPFAMMHSEEPPSIVERYAVETNNVIKRTCDLFSGRFAGVAGLPQSPALAPSQWTGELRRCVEELGFVGCLLNPDPREGVAPPLPPLGDRFWYPVYEALCELRTPALIHAAGCRPPARETYSVHFILEETVAVASLLASPVFDDFPELVLVISHGGGAIPYQFGRFLADGARSGSDPLERLRRLWFDTCLYTPEAIELLLRTVGPDRCLYGSEKPGSGSARDPESGRFYDDVRTLLDGVEWLTAAERQAIYADNARRLYRLPPAGTSSTAPSAGAPTAGRMT